jgi:hypothetical protein
VLSDPTLMVTHPIEQPGGGQILFVPCYCPASACACTAACACDIRNCAYPELPNQNITDDTYNWASNWNTVGIAEGFAAMVEACVDVGAGIIFVGWRILCRC